MIHELKILPQYFEAVLSGDKTFEVRSVADRTFSCGDNLRLREFDPEMHNRSASGYSGREITVQVTYVLDGIEYKGEPAVVMSIFTLRDDHQMIKEAMGQGLVTDFRDEIIKRG